MCSCRVWSPGEPVMWKSEHSWKTAGRERKKKKKKKTRPICLTSRLPRGHFLFSKQQLEPYSLLCDKNHETITLIQKHSCSEKTSQLYFLLLFIFNHVVWLQAMDSFQSTSVKLWGGWTEVYQSPEESPFRTWFQFLWK